MKYLDHEIIQTVGSVFRFNDSYNTDMAFQKQVLTKYIHFFIIDVCTLVWLTNKYITLCQCG